MFIFVYQFFNTVFSSRGIHLTFSSLYYHIIHNAVFIPHTITNTSLLGTQTSDLEACSSGYNDRGATQP